MTRVLPHVTVDLVSWSSYDGAGNVVKMWQGIELIRHYLRPSPFYGKNAVFLGEIGRREDPFTPAQILDFWDVSMGVSLAMDIPWIVQWELNCNEPMLAATKRTYFPPRTADQMRGFWLIRPDGSLSYGGEYLTALLKNAGKTLFAETVVSLKQRKP